MAALVKIPGTEEWVNPAYVTNTCRVAENYLLRTHTELSVIASNNEGVIFVTKEYGVKKITTLAELDVVIAALNQD